MCVYVCVGKPLLETSKSLELSLFNFKQNPEIIFLIHNEIESASTLFKLMDIRTYLKFANVVSLWHSLAVIKGKLNSYPNHIPY